MTERKDEFSAPSPEAGKPIKAARSEFDRAIFTFNVAAEESTRIYGEYLPARLAGIHCRPLGHRPPIPARPHRRHHAIQFSH